MPSKNVLGVVIDDVTLVMIRALEKQLSYKQADIARAALRTYFEFVKKFGYEFVVRSMREDNEESITNYYGKLENKPTKIELVFEDDILWQKSKPTGIPVKNKEKTGAIQKKI